MCPGNGNTAFGNRLDRFKLSAFMDSDIAFVNGALTPNSGEEAKMGQTL